MKHERALKLKGSILECCRKKVSRFIGVFWNVPEKTFEEKGNNSRTL